jgi:hypothetical protein
VNKFIFDFFVLKTFAFNHCQAMYQLLGDLRSLFKTKRIHIDNVVLRLHHALTFSVLLACCIVVSTREYAGQPIICQSDQLPNLPTELLDSFCWTHATYVSMKALNAQVGVDVPQPGVTHSIDPNDLRHAAYYQWVWVLLFVMALCFYLPQWLWKNYEGGLVERLLKDFELKCTPCGTAETTPIESVVAYLRLTQGTHNSYAFR